MDFGKICDEHGELLALVIRASYAKPGITFFTDQGLSQQLAHMRRPPGEVIPPHVHRPVTRAVHDTQEVLVIRSGRVRADIYNKSCEYMANVVLGPGDVLMLVAGGHGFTILEEADIIEIKQGPYMGVDADKTRFRGSAPLE